jgi:hypothetical protein
MRDPVVVTGGGGNSTAIFAIVAVIVVAALVALFIWQPWNARTSTESTTVITNPVVPGATPGAASTSAPYPSTKTTP